MRFLLWAEEQRLPALTRAVFDHHVCLRACSAAAAFSTCSRRAQLRCESVRLRFLSRLVLLLWRQAVAANAQSLAHVHEFHETDEDKLASKYQNEVSEGSLGSLRSVRHLLAFVYTLRNPLWNEGVSCLLDETRGNAFALLHCSRSCSTVQSGCGAELASECFPGTMNLVWVLQKTESSPLLCRCLILLPSRVCFWLHAAPLYLI